MIFVKNSRGGREVNMINNMSKINLSKISVIDQVVYCLSFLLTTYVKTVRSGDYIVGGNLLLRPFHK